MAIYNTMLRQIEEKAYNTNQSRSKKDKIINMSYTSQYF